MGSLCCQPVPSLHKNYNPFIGTVTSQEVPVWDQNIESLYKQFLNRSDTEVADKPLHTLDTTRGEKWKNTDESIDFKKSGRKAWSLLGNLGDAGPAP